MRQHIHTPTSSGHMRLHMADGLGHTLPVHTHTHAPAYVLYTVRGLSRQQGLHAGVGGYWREVLPAPTYRGGGCWIGSFWGHVRLAEVGREIPPRDTLSVGRG